MTSLRNVSALSAILLFLFNFGAHAQSREEVQIASLENRVAQLEGRVNELKNNGENSGEAGLSLFLCAVFCALWAQNTGRSAWLWFFLGLIFSVITLIVLLNKNSNQNRSRFNIQDFRRQ